MDNANKSSVDTLVTCYVQPGTCHVSQNKESEDAAYHMEAPDLLFYGLADGQSGKQYCRIGGEAVLKTVAEYLKDVGIAKLRRHEHIDEIQYEIIRLVRQTVSNLAKEHSADSAEFSSTLVVFAINPNTSEYMYIHLGDGGIIGRKSDNSINMISNPENGITTQYTWLTTSPNALLHLRIGFGSTECYGRVILFTDGASVICRGKNIPRAAIKLILEKGNQVKIAEYIKQSEHVDDAGCIVIDFVGVDREYSDYDTHFC